MCAYSTSCRQFLDALNLIPRLRPSTTIIPCSLDPELSTNSSSSRMQDSTLTSLSQLGSLLHERGKLSEVLLGHVSRVGFRFQSLGPMAWPSRSYGSVLIIYMSQHFLGFRSLSAEGLKSMWVLRSLRFSARSPSPCQPSPPILGIRLWVGVSRLGALRFPEHLAARKPP